ncbi:MAG TPA: hypothetical protein VK993_04805 [Chthoniobacterales bacterium]|nr:hypothetical protein [Chthoniobacterales bacterium]
MLRSLELSGQFGDTFGSINALFSGLAFVAIYGSLQAQHRESAEQQHQFRKQLELGALTAFAELTQSMWLKNVDEFRRNPSDAKRDAMQNRYGEMIEAREALKQI